MGSWGALIMGFFGSVFAALTLYLQWSVTGAALIVPFLAFAAIGLAAALVIRSPGEGVAVSDKAGRVIMWSSIGEGIGLFLAANVVINLGHADWLLPAMALVVGLHFLPIAQAAPFRPFYALGGALILSAIAGLIANPPLGGEIAEFVAATALWIAAALAVRRDLRAKLGGAKPPADR